MWQNKNRIFNLCSHPEQKSECRKDKKKKKDDDKQEMFTHTHTWINEYIDFCSDTGI